MIDGLLYKTIAFLGLVHGKYTQLLCNVVPKGNHSTRQLDKWPYNKIHSSTLNHPKAGWFWEVALYDEMPICCRVRILFISEFEDPFRECLQWPSKVPKRSGPHFSKLWLQIS
jgi:hypothetical protein